MNLGDWNYKLVVSSAIFSRGSSHLWQAPNKEVRLNEIRENQKVWIAYLLKKLNDRCKELEIDLLYAIETKAIPVEIDFTGLECEQHNNMPIIGIYKGRLICDVCKINFHQV